MIASLPIVDGKIASIGQPVQESRIDLQRGITWRVYAWRIASLSDTPPREFLSSDHH